MGRLIESCFNSKACWKWSEFCKTFPRHCDRRGTVKNWLGPMVAPNSLTCACVVMSWMGLSHNSQISCSTSHNGPFREKVHISVLNGALRDRGHVHRSIYKLDRLVIHVNGYNQVQILSHGIHTYIGWCMCARAWLIPGVSYNGHLACKWLIFRRCLQYISVRNCLKHNQIYSAVCAFPNINYAHRSLIQSPSWTAKNNPNHSGIRLAGRDMPYIMLRVKTYKLSIHFKLKNFCSTLVHNCYILCYCGSKRNKK